MPDAFHDKGGAAKPESVIRAAGRDCRGYEREVECDRELYQVIALDAKGIPHSRITANVAAKLLSEAAQAAGETWADAEPSKTATRKPVRTEPVASGREQQAAVRH